MKASGKSQRTGSLSGNGEGRRDDPEQELNEAGRAKPCHPARVPPESKPDSQVQDDSGAGPYWILKRYVAPTWFHPVGVLKVLRRIEDRLPNVAGRLFITFTVDPKLFANEASAYEHTRDQLRRIFFQLRRGVTHEGRKYVIDAPYCVKTEFHESGWVHYHVIFLTRRHIPAALIADLWGFGRVNVKRIDADGFRYLLKYVTKADALPDWVKSRKRVRVFQSSRGFLKPLPKKKPAEEESPFEPKTARASYTIEERLARWARTALLIRGSKVKAIRFREPFQDIFDRLVLPVALAGRYLGNGQIKINKDEEILLWLKSPNKTKE